jgi:hypothetical protein
MQLTEKKSKQKSKQVIIKYLKINILEEIKC